MLVALESGNVRELHLGAADRDPAWSPDGRGLAVVSDRGGPSQVWTVDVSGRNPVPVTGCPPAARWPAFSPDGRLIAIFAEGAVWVLPVAGGKTTRLSPAATAAPVFSAQDELAFAGLDGIGIASGTNLGLRTQIETGGPVLALAWSPDGQQLAWIGHRQGSAPGADNHVLLRSVAGGPIVDLTADLGRSVGIVIRADDPRAVDPPRLTWDPVRGRIHYSFVDQGCGPLGSVSPTRELSRSDPAAEACLALAAAGDTTVVVVATAADPGQLVLLEGGSRRTLLNSNPWLRGRSVAPRRILVDRADRRVEGWLLSPPGPPERELPLVVYVHGGPHSAFGHRFDFEFQRIASAGRAVLLWGGKRRSGSQCRFPRCAIANLTDARILASASPRRPQQPTVSS